jgi:hypothetical protein
MKMVPEKNLTYQFDYHEIKNPVEFKGFHGWEIKIILGSESKSGCGR